MIRGQLSRILVTRGAGSHNPRFCPTTQPRTFYSTARRNGAAKSKNYSPPKSESLSPGARPFFRRKSRGVQLRNPVLSFAGPKPLDYDTVDQSWARLKQQMSNFVRIVATPSADTAGASLMVHFDQRRYHFGSLCQGLQRAYVQRGLPAAKLERMFISGTIKWDNMGGLLGLMLTVADSLDNAKQQIVAQNVQRKEKNLAALAVPDNDLDVFGGENLTYAVATARNFIFRQGLPINTVDFDEDPRKNATKIDWSKPDWEDQLLRVWHVPLVPQSAGLKSPRKRSFDVMSEAEPDGNLAPTSPRSARRSAKKTSQAVVDAMFKSDWSRDRLVETPLGEVKLPAKLWVRESGKLEEYKGPLPSEDPSAAATKVFVREPWPSVQTLSLPPTDRSVTSTCYVVKNRGRRGKFDPKAAKALGVAVLDYKKLTAGQSVPGKDGTTVTPDMVMGESILGVGFAFADVPSEDYIQSFIERPEWKSAELLDGVHVVYWNLGKGVFDDERIQEFMRSKSSLKHIVMGQDISPNMITYESFAGLYTALGGIDPDRFPILNFDNTHKDISSAGESAIIGRTGMKATLLPNFALDDADVVPFPDLQNGRWNPSPRVRKLAEDARTKISQPAFQAEVEADEKDIPNRDAEIITLGTGSALPSKYRNVSATLIRIPGVGNYLLDCGENTTGQMRRIYDKDEYERTIKDLKAIFISHMHADHHLGIAGVLSHWYRLTEDTDSRITVCGPPEMKKWIQEYSNVEVIGRPRIQFIESQNATPDKTSPEDLARCGLESIHAVRVHHCYNAYAGVLTWPSGLKIAYSGDCRPSPAFAAAGRNATLLIHESTFDEDKAQDAQAKKHCTMPEALDIASKMRARRVMLTHFSQRYSKIPLLGKRVVSGDDSGEAVKDQVVLFALDQMRVKLGEFRHAEAFLPALRQMFMNADEEGDD